MNEAVKAVRDMEQRGIVGTACVYYELARCLCNNQRWQEAIMEASFFIVFGNLFLFSVLKTVYEHRTTWS